MIGKSTFQDYVEINIQNKFNEIKLKNLIIITKPLNLSLRV